MTFSKHGSRRTAPPSAARQTEPTAVELDLAEAGLHRLHRVALLPAGGGVGGVAPDAAAPAAGVAAVVLVQARVGVVGGAVRVPVGGLGVPPLAQLPAAGVGLAPAVVRPVGADQGLKRDTNGPGASRAGKNSSGEEGGGSGGGGGDPPPFQQDSQT